MGNVRWGLVGYLILVAGILVSLLSIEAARRERVNQINRVNFGVCSELENLKRAERQDALERFAQLDETLKLLGIKKTPMIVDRAEADRDRALERFKEKPCPEEIID
jgi:hypothetical protein